MKITLMDNSSFYVPPLFVGAGSDRVPLNLAEDGGVQLCFSDDSEREIVLRDLFIQTAQDRQAEIIFWGPRPNGYREILHGFQDFDMRLKPSDRTEDWLSTEHLMGRQNFSEGKTYSVVFVASMEYLLNDLTYKGPVETRGRSGIEQVLDYSFSHAVERRIYPVLFGDRTCFNRYNGPEDRTLVTFGNEDADSHRIHRFMRKTITPVPIRGKRGIISTEHSWQAFDA